jgi:hypothetical protein
MSAVKDRKSVPLWLQILGWGVLLYLVLWGATYFSGLWQIRVVRREMLSAGRIELARDFDPSVEPPALEPEDERIFFFYGRLRSPCPLIATYDVVTYSQRHGSSNHWTSAAFFDWNRGLDCHRYWEY